MTNYDYDEFNRLTGKETSHVVTEDSSKTFNSSVDYTYTESGNNLSTQIETYTSTFGNNGSVTYAYTYDANGNITKISYSTGEEICYRYDDLGQLIREDNSTVGFTHVYIYDNAGNITEAKRYLLTDENEEVSPSDYIYSETYVYSDSAWGDRLTSYNGYTITYDGIGNPLSYYNGTSYTFTWNGRQLTGATIGSNVYSFTYDDQGMRTSKTKDGKTVTYYYSGGLLIGEFCEDYGITYIYENDVSPIGMKYYDPDGAIDIYWFEKNLQGDIVAVYGDLWGICPTKFASYTYDAWGNATATYYNGGESKSVVNNPFLYRGYYYDSDLDLYYLGSRYYDSNTGRFINADTIIDGDAGIIGYNLYIYVANNPVNYLDPHGKWIIKDAIKWISKNIVEPIVDTVKDIGEGTNATLTNGLNFNLNLGGLSYDLSIGVSTDTKGNVALQTTFAANFSISDPGVAITGVSTVTNAPTVYNLEDFGVQTGGSVATDIKGVPVVIGGDLVFIPDEKNNKTYYGQSVNVGLGTPGKEFHVGMSSTKTLISINIFDVVYKIIDKIERW